LSLIFPIDLVARYHACFAVIFMIYNLGLLGDSLIKERGVSVSGLIRSE
jgi:hypothetical protein